MKVTITIEAGSATISEALENIASYFEGGEFDEVESSTRSVKSTINQVIYDGGDANDGYGDIVGKIKIESSKRPKKKKS